MFEKIKKYVKEHEREFKIAGGVVVAAGVGYFIGKEVCKCYTKLPEDLRGKDIIAWVRNREIDMNLEQVKEFIDMNANNTAKFAIFREGPVSTAFEIIAFPEPGGDILGIPESYKPVLDAFVNK